MQLHMITNHAPRDLHSYKTQLQRSKSFIDYKSKVGLSGFVLEMNSVGRQMHDA